MAEDSDSDSFDLWFQADEIGFPPYFQKYEANQQESFSFGGRKENYWVLWNADNEEPEHPPGFLCSSWELKEKITVILKRFMNCNASSTRSMLVLFWEPVLIEGRILLTNRHQPFAINSTDGLCRYRERSESYKFYVDEWHIKDELGLPGRVFIHKISEMSPNIEYYSIKEYPQQQDALRCQITSVNAYPVLDPSRQSCIGVLEVAWSRETASIGYPCPCYICGFPRGEDLKIPDLQFHSCRPIGDDEEAFKAASDEIYEVLKKVCEAHNLELAQLWTLCSRYMPNASYTGQLISTPGFSYARCEGYCSGCDACDFADICGSLHLREGQGVVGEAFSSHGLIFCSDITQFSIVEYPLAHFALFHGLRSSFAICLQSSHTGSHVFVLEFFLPSSPRVNESVINMLRSILYIMKLHIRTLKLASGKDLGEKLPIQVVDYRNGEKRKCYTLEEESQITTSPQSPRGTLQDQQGPSSQQPIEKVTNAEQCDINCTKPPGNGTSKNLKRPESETGIQLGLNDILPHAKRKIADAAKDLKVSRSTLKRICREHNINRWPPRNIEENCSQPQGDGDGQQILSPSHGMPSSSNQVLPTIASTNSHDTMMPDVNFVNVKAKYEDDIIKFELLSSSGLAELQHEITKRLKLTGGTYNIKYEDEENDFVSITCDEDVRYWIRTCGSQGSNSLKVFLLLK